VTALTTLLDTLESQFRPRDTLTLEPFLGFLKAIGDPHKTLPLTIHLAGTNGKGSTSALLRAILEAAGYRVHAYTSPHLVCMTERLVLAGEEITQSSLTELIEQFWDQAKACDLTWFEVITGVAFHAFASVPADVVLLETGLGGQYDATNVISDPRITVLTPISHDHHRFLGHSLGEIAQAKAGILKSGAVCVSASQPKEVLTVIKERVQQLGIPLSLQGQDWDITTNQDDDVLFQYQNEQHSLPKPNLLGPHQVQNAGTALAVLKAISEIFPVSEAAIKKGLGTVKWPGRLERIGETKDGAKVWYDVAHNPAATQAVQAFFKGRPGKKVLIFALLKSKDLETTLRPFLEGFDQLIFFSPQDPHRYHDPEAAQAIVHKNGGTCLLSPSLLQAFDLIHDASDILIAGSHYFAHELQELSSSLFLK